MFWVYSKREFVGTEIDTSCSEYTVGLLLKQLTICPPAESTYFVTSLIDGAASVLPFDILLPSSFYF
jgi:hypothetical protein